MKNQKVLFFPTFILLMIAVFSPVAPQSGPVVKESRAVSGDVALFVRTAGDISSGHVLLAVNGGPGVSSRYLEDLGTLAGPDLAVVTYDQRGVGRSSRPSLETGQFTFDKYLEDIESVRKSLHLESFHLLGHSWGGVLALKYAAVHPGRVDSIILIGSGPLRHDEFMEAIANIRKRVIELMKAGVIDPKLPRHSDIYPAYLSDPRFKPKTELISDLDEQVQNITLEAVKEYDLRTEAAKIDKRVLILWGRDDVVGLDIAEKTRAALSAARVELSVIEHCGHYWQEQPEEYFSRIRRFLGLSIFS
ncbi:MAG: alpha/beta fold hydrolase [Candidatus Aminicenantes bacterium]|nr:alpha/beta fold hydrolase [Candidatus Aminicenantes bacterium]